MGGKIIIKIKKKSLFPNGEVGGGGGLRGAKIIIKKKNQ